MTGHPPACADTEAYPPGEPEAQLSADSFRHALGAFATGVLLVTTHLGGVDYIMTANAFTSVSLDPPLVLVCVHRTSRFHAALLASGTWGVSVLPATRSDLSARFAARGRPVEGRFADVPHRRGTDTGTVLLAEALATMECATHAVHDGGDHSIVVGHVLTLNRPATTASPLLFHTGAYHTLGPPTAAPTQPRPPTENGLGAIRASSPPTCPPPQRRWRPW